MMSAKISCAAGSYIFIMFISISPPVKYFYWPFQGGASFVDHLCYFCFEFVSWSTSELGVRLARLETGLSHPVKYFYWPFQGGASFVDHLCYFCLVMLSCTSVYWCLVVTCWEKALSRLPIKLTEQGTKSYLWHDMFTNLFYIYALRPSKHFLGHVRTFFCLPGLNQY